jgi:hypothetical protein
MRIAFDSLEAKDKKKNEAAVKKAELSVRSSMTSNPEGQCSGRGSIDSGTERFVPFFVPRTTPGAQPSIRSVLKKMGKKEANRVVGRCFFWSDIPLNITKNNPFWQPMCDAIAVVGPGYKSHTFEELWGPILQEENDINSRLVEFKQSWEISGCTMMSNGWTDRKGRSLFSFLVHCPRGTMFIKSINALAHVKDATLLCELMDATLFIQEINMPNVLQIIIDNATNYVVVGS